jgi:hypothetical protein
MRQSKSTSFDDGRETNRVDSVGAAEDLMRRFRLATGPTITPSHRQFGATFMPSFSQIDFARYTTTPLFDPSNPYIGFGAPLTYPVLFDLPNAAQSPWRLDADGDLMPDMFEIYYSLDPNRNNIPQRREAQAGGDLDGDLLNNLQEYYAGTDPMFHDSDGNGV